MKFVHTADWHIGALRNRLPDDYLQRDYEMLKAIGDVVENESDGVMVMAGDVFDRKFVTNEERDLLISELMRLDKIGVKLIFINGNHDITHDRTSNLNFLDILCSYKKINMVLANCKPHVEVVAGIPFVLYPPSTKVDPKLTPSVIRAYIKKRKITGAVVVSHFRVGGSLEESDRPLDGVDLLSLKVDRYVRFWALGDVHRRQPLNDGAWYSGSPIQHRKGDKLPKGVLTVDTDNLSIQQINIESTPLDRFEAISAVWQAQSKIIKPSIRGDIETVDIRQMIPEEVAKHLEARGVSERDRKDLLSYMNGVISSIADKDYYQ